MSTFISSLLIFFFLCLSMHTCNARHLGVIMDDSNASYKKHLFSTKVLESVKQLNKEERISVDEEGSSGDCIIFHENHAVKQPKASDSLLREMKQNIEISAVPVPIKPLVSVSVSGGTANFKPSTPVSLLRATSIEGGGGSRRRALSMVVVEQEQEHGSESDVKQDKDDDPPHQLEDASVRDYDPPHQKPPIHNRQT